VGSKCHLYITPKIHRFGNYPKHLPNLSMSVAEKNALVFSSLKPNKNKDKKYPKNCIFFNFKKP
jgi:uncharacterized protein (DUF608 family)